MSSDDLSDQPTGSLPHVLKNKQWWSAGVGSKGVLQDEALLALQACLTASTQDSNTASVARSKQHLIIRSVRSCAPAGWRLLCRHGNHRLAKGPQQWKQLDELYTTDSSLMLIPHPGGGGRYARSHGLTQQRPLATTPPPVNSPGPVSSTALSPLAELPLGLGLGVDS
eukprot:gene2567-30952_t